MPFKLGTQDVTEIYLGDTALSSLLIGEEEVGIGALPDGYVFLRGKLQDGSYSLIQGLTSPTNYTNIIGKVS